MGARTVLDFDQGGPFPDDFDHSGADDADSVESIVNHIAPGVSDKPELYALISAVVVVYKHRERIAATFRKVTTRARRLRGA